MRSLQLISRTTRTAFALQKAINSVANIRTFHSSSNNSIITAKSERISIGSFLIDRRRNLSSTTTKSEENMSTAIYEEIKDLPSHPEKTLIDVREPDELKQTGVIPTSINIPLAEVTNALNLSDEQFKVKYERTKPSKTSEIVFSCKLGGRAGKAGVAAAALGFENIKIYKGSWTDWAQHEGLPV